jgi:Methyltransferase domain
MNGADPPTLPRHHPVIYAGLKATGQQLSSQRTILAYLAEIRAFRSVVEFGCGRASWLHAARQLGAKEIRGYDNIEMPMERRGLTPQQFVRANINQPIELEKKFDLAICVGGTQEVSESTSATLIQTLCAASNWILFAAALPYQSGKRLANEFWLESWAKLFSDSGFTCYDILRRTFWHDARVAYYYRQSVCLFIRPGAHYALKARGFEPSARPPSLVHPEMYLRAASRIPGRRDIGARVRSFYRAAGKAVTAKPVVAGGPAGA